VQEGEQADTTQQGGKAPKNPITGEPLTPVTNKDKEGYQATVLAGQSEETSARVMKQLDAQPDGRPFGGERLSRALRACCVCVCVWLHSTPVSLNVCVCVDAPGCCVHCAAPISQLRALCAGPLCC
jgi:hypothetical protein